MGEVELKEYVERLLDEHQKRENQRHDQEAKAQCLMTKNLEYRLEHLNELRDQVMQDRSQFVTVDKYESQHENLSKRVDVVTASINRYYGIAIAISFISGVVGGIIVKLFGL
jgi:hypothetical protein